ncbi:MAG: hypothetical protein J7L55_05280, partial [Desulfurococcales archaeon]|nr:hypothetical protein [Desulfurococcales archaeon]
MRELAAYALALLTLIPVLASPGLESTPSFNSLESNLTAYAGQFGVIVARDRTAYLKVSGCNPLKVGIPDFRALSALAAGKEFFIAGIYRGEPALAVITVSSCRDVHVSISYIPDHEGALIKLVPAENGVMGLGYVVINSTYAGLVL